MMFTDFKSSDILFISKQGGIHMRSLIILVLCCLLFVGCTQSTPASEFITPSTSETLSKPAPMEIIVYHGNVNADGFEVTSFEVSYYNGTILVEKLIETGALAEGVELLSETYEGTCLHLDFNDAFRDLVCSMGSSGEYIVIGSVVNTFLDNYSDVAQSVFITVNGELFESGHVIYDFELTRHE